MKAWERSIDDTIRAEVKINDQRPGEWTDRAVRDNLTLMFADQTYRLPSAFRWAWSQLKESELYGESKHRSVLEREYLSDERPNPQLVQRALTRMASLCNFYGRGGQTGLNQPVSGAEFVDDWDMTNVQDGHRHSSGVVRFHTDGTYDAPGSGQQHEE